MEQHAPDMVWRDDLVWWGDKRASGWSGAAPAWSAERAKPAGTDELLNDRRLELVVIYPEAFPAAPPALYPVDPEVPIERRIFHKWHVNGDGSLCLMQAADDWQLTDTAASLVRKASGWFLEYLLVEAGDLAAMTLAGAFSDNSIDDLLAKYAI